MVRGLQHALCERDDGVLSVLAGQTKFELDVANPAEIRAHMEEVYFVEMIVRELLVPVQSHGESESRQNVRLRNACLEVHVEFAMKPSQTQPYLATANPIPVKKAWTRIDTHSHFPFRTRTSSAACKML